MACNFTSSVSEKDDLEVECETKLLSDITRNNESSNNSTLNLNDILEIELLNISKAFPTIESKAIRSLLEVYKDIKKQERINYVCSDLIKKLEDPADVMQLITEASIIKDLFPELNEAKIFMKLKKKANHLGRTQDVIKEIISEEKAVSFLNTSKENLLEDFVLEEIIVTDTDPITYGEINNIPTTADHSVNEPTPVSVEKDELNNNLFAIEENVKVCNFGEDVNDLHVPTTSRDYRFNVPLAHSVNENVGSNSLEKPEETSHFGQTDLGTSNNAFHRNSNYFNKTEVNEYDQYLLNDEKLFQPNSTNFNAPVNDYFNLFKIDRFPKNPGYEYNPTTTSILDQPKWNTPVNLSNNYNKPEVYKCTPNLVNKLDQTTSVPNMIKREELPDKILFTDFPSETKVRDFQYSPDNRIGNTTTRLNMKIEDELKVHGSLNRTHRVQSTEKKRKSAALGSSKKLKTNNIKKKNNNLNKLIDLMDIDNDCSKGAIIEGNKDSTTTPFFIDLANDYEPTEKNLDSTKLYYQVLEMFGDIEHTYLRNICKKYNNDPKAIESVIDEILSGPDYPKRSVTPEPEPPYDQEAYLERLKQFLPEADPTYLMESLQNIKNQQQLEEFVMTSLEKHNYPTMKDYLRKQKLAAQAKQYTTEFHVEQFLEVIPDPIKYFESPDEKKLPIVLLDKSYCQISNFLKNHFSLITIKTISSVLTKSKTFIEAVQILENYNERMSCKRKTKYPVEELFNIPLLQAFAYVAHKKEILHALSYKKELIKHKRSLAKGNGTILTCSCCYDDEVLPEDSINCPSNCIFCKDCLTKCVEIGFGEGKYDYPCLANCGTQFSLQALKNGLPPKMFSKLAQKKQLEEIKAAGLEELEFCPFCDFGTIPIPGDKLFRCLNPECMKESCRQCKETSHIPLTCEEVEKDDDVKKRTYIENKMTEALIRICYKCNIKFIKQDGCNKMTCSRCGSTMCYVCNKPVADYKHFNGQGGDKFNLCPLYSDDLEMHKLEVLKVAEAAKKEIGATDLKIDPQQDIAQHYDELKKKKTKDVPPGINIRAQLDLIEANLLARVHLNHP